LRRDYGTMKTIRGAPLPNPTSPGSDSLADLIFRPVLPGSETDALLLGSLGRRPVDVSLVRFRSAVLDLVDRCEAAGLHRGIQCAGARAANQRGPQR
jgi:hypothetical protein